MRNSLLDVVTNSSLSEFIPPPTCAHHARVLGHGVEPLECRDGHAQESACGVLLGGVELLLLAARVRGECRPGGGVGAAGLNLMDIM